MSFLNQISSHHQVPCPFLHISHFAPLMWYLQGLKLFFFSSSFSSCPGVQPDWGRLEEQGLGLHQLHLQTLWRSDRSRSYTVLHEVREEMNSFRLAFVLHHRETWMSCPNTCCLKNLSPERRTVSVLQVTWVMRISFTQDFLNNNRAKFHPLLSTVGTPAFISAGLHFLRGFRWYFSTSCSHIKTWTGINMVVILSTCLFQLWIQWDVFTPDTSIIYILSFQTSTSLLDVLRARLLPKSGHPLHLCPCMLTYQLKHCIKLSLEVNQVLFRDSVQMLLVASHKSSPWGFPKALLAS